MTKQIQGYRLSPQQRRAWSLATSDKDAGRASTAILLDGPLDFERLAGALETVVSRHEILRTTFHKLPGMAFPLQVIAPSFRPALTIQPFADAEATIDASIDAAFAEVWAEPIAAGETPSLTASVTTLGPDRHVLIVSISALCADAVGLGNLTRAIGDAYAAAPDADQDVLPYTVISDWLNETLESDDAEAGKRFWHSQLVDPTAAASSLTRGATGRIGRVAMSIDARTADAIERCATRLATSPAGLLTAAWQVLLWRLWGGSALPIATRLDGRSTPDLADVIGPMSRNAPVTAAIDGASSFAHVVASVEAALQEAAAWQECYDPGELLGGATAQYLPYVVEYRTGQPAQRAGELTLRTVATSAHADRAALLQSFVRGPDGIDGQLEYDTQRFSSDEAARLVARLETLITSVLADASQPVSRLAILPVGEAHIVTREFNSTAVAFDGPRIVHHAFEAQAARTPDRIAVSFGDQALTYRQLDARANQLAHRLIRAGVGPNVPVGLLMERSIDMVVGMFGALKAGGAYIPLDAEYPAERLAYMIGNARAAAIVTHERFVGQIADASATVIRLDRDAAEIAGEPDTAPEVATDPENLAYVLYTSGSTGHPKGVMIPHRALCNHMQWMQREFPIGERDSVLQKTPFSFDASVWEFYAPLLTGGRLVMAQPGGHRDAEYLCQTIAREGITTLQLVPTLLRMMLDQPGFAACTSLARVYCGGEALSVDLRDRFHRVTSADLINLYGPTECTIDATFHVCRRSDAGVPIGRPVANTAIYLLDEHRQPVPLGVPGELYIGGDSVGLGYLHNAQLTSERFLDDAFRGSGVLYRTGDLGRYTPDGNIEYLGRIDNQIKLRGHRIELGEIEATLARHADLSACVVVVREDQPGDKRLAAYFIPHAGKSPRTAELRQLVKDQLPEYMVPSAFVKLGQLPLLPNGKVDQRSLPAPDDSDADLADAFVAPRNELESEVAQIWREVLGISKVGIHDDFFALGGHSLIATQLTSRIRKLFHVDLPLRELFAAPTVFGLAERIAKLQAEMAEVADMADMLTELEGLSDDEVRALLSESEPALAAG